MDDFTGRRIAVTGAAGGIGSGIASHLAGLGAEVHALDLREPHEAIAGVMPVLCDITDEKSVVAMVARLYEADERPVDLVNCAGIVEDNVAAEDAPMDLYDRVMGVNLRGVFLTCREFGRKLLELGGGSIVNIASMSGNALVNAPQRQSVYNASKAGVSALTRSLAVEWGPRGVRVNALSPGYVDTPLNHLKKDMHDEWLSGTVLGRFGTIDEVADAVTFLLSARAGYFCGAELLMDGGSSLR